MKDRDFLIWIHARLSEVHGESEHFGYMHKLRAIIGATDPDTVTSNKGTSNSLDEFLKQIEFSESEHDVGN